MALPRLRRRAFVRRGNASASHELAAGRSVRVQWLEAVGFPENPLASSVGTQARETQATGRIFPHAVQRAPSRRQPPPAWRFALAQAAIPPANCFDPTRLGHAAEPNY